MTVLFHLDHHKENNMGKSYLVIIAFLFISNQCSAQTTYTWNGGVAEDYQVAANWTPVRSVPAANDILAFNATSAIVINNVPLQTIGAIQIASGTNKVSFATNSSANILTLSAAVPLIYTTPGTILSADFLTIRLSNLAAFTLSSGTFGIADGTGGKIIINSALTLSGATLDFDVTGSGGTTITGSVTYISGVFACINASSIVWGPTSNYYHNSNGSGPSAIPASTWQNGSTCNITGMNTGSIAPTGFTPTIFFSNFTWNCPSQAGNVGLLPAGLGTQVNINGTLTITNTNSKELQLLSNTGSATITAGSYSQTGGTLTLQAASLVTDSTTLSISGTFFQNGGNLYGVSGATAGTAILDLKGNVTRSGGVWQSIGTNSSSQLIVQFSGANVQNVDLSGGSWNSPAKGRTNVVNNNTNLVNGINLTGVLRVANTSSALPATFTMNGIITGGNGSYTGAGTGGTSLIYSGSFPQIATAVEFPSVNGPSHLTINNTLGISFPASFSRTLTGTLTLQNGNLAVGSGNTLSLTNPTLANQLSYTGGFITTGTLGRYFPTSGLPTAPGTNATRFPFGSGANDRTLNLFFSSGTLTGGTAGMIYVTHTPSIGITAISVPDNGITLDKRTNTNWTISTGAGTFNIGGGGETVSLTAVAANIGSVDDYTHLRLTDGATAYGNLIPTFGTNAIPVVGKTGLIQSDINKTIYVGSDNVNPLIIITFTWVGGTSTDWTTAANWTGGVGYPSASTEIAIITNTSATFQPTINTGSGISVYQLTVGAGMTLSLASGASLIVYDNVNYSGAASFNPASTFGYASSNGGQTILDLPYGNLTVSGTGPKTLAPSVTVTGNYSLSGYPPIIGTGTFTYAGTGGQKVAPGSYYNLTITNNRGGQTIGLGTNIANNTIDVKNVFTVSGLSNYKVNASFNFFNFSSPGSQTIPGFLYSRITNSNGNRILDNLGSASPDSTHIIYCRALGRGTGTYTVNGSKVNLYVLNPTGDVTYLGDSYYDLTISGDNNKFAVDFFSGATVSIAGTFNFTVTNFKQTSNVYTMLFNGVNDLTIPAFKTTVATNTPSFKFSNVVIAGGNRNVTFAGNGTDTIGLRGSLVVSSPFSAGKGFIVGNSTISFSVGSSTIPLLTPSGAGTYSYNNINIYGGTHNLGGNNMTIGGNLTVNGVVNSVDTLQGVLNIGDGNTSRVLNVLGNMVASGTGISATLVTGQFDMNTGTTGSTRVNLAGNLSITGQGQLMGTTSVGAFSNGKIVFNGTTQTYVNSSSYKNGLVNFIVGDGVTATKLILASQMNLLASAGTSNRDTLTVSANASLDCGTNNIVSNGSGFANFNLLSGATLITANTGGVEGPATGGTDGSIINNGTVVNNYNALASYVFNAPSSTNTSFPLATTPFPMANLTVGNDVNSATFSLNKSIDVSNTLTLRSFSVLAVVNNHLNLKSTVTTTARIAAVPDNANITYGSGRFVVERYYPARRAWRLVTAPVIVDNTNTVFNSWQMSGATTSGSGTFVTGPGANPAANGLDVSPQNNYSLKTFDVTTNNLVGVSNTYNQLISGTIAAPGAPANIGMFLFVRGDRSTPNLFNTSFSNITTLRDTGKVQIHGQTFNLSAATGKWDIIGNPYASPVDITSLVTGTANINNSFFWAYDPYLNATDGGYVVMSWDGTTWTPTPSRPGGQDKNIQSSQAFFVQKINASPAAMTFTETNKSSQNNPNFFRPLLQPGRFSTNLYLQEADTSRVLADGTMAAFDNSYSLFHIIKCHPDHITFYRVRIYTDPRTCFSNFNYHYPAVFSSPALAVA